jgi:methionyl-tRNA synthetase
LIAKVNSDLVGKFVNIASRCAGFIAKRFDGKLAEHDPPPPSTGTSTKSAAFESRDFSRALRKIMEFADQANGYVNDNKPWELAKQEGQDARLHVVCTTAINIFKALTGLLKPVLPTLAAQVEAFLAIEPLTWNNLSRRCPPATPSTPTATS